MEVERKEVKQNIEFLKKVLLYQSHRGVEQTNSKGS